MKQGKPQSWSNASPQTTPDSAVFGKPLNATNPDMSSLLPPADSSMQVLQENRQCGQASLRLLDNACWLYKKHR